VPSKPGRATVVLADYAPTNHLGGDWHRRAPDANLEDRQRFNICYPLHCRQTDANSWYFYGTNSPSLLPTSLSSSHSSKPLASFNNLLLHYTRILICHLVSLSCGITEHLRGHRACFFPPRTSIARLPIQYTAGRSPTYRHPESLSKPERPEEFSNT
jgi:hypothetical protein